MHLKDDTFAKK